MYEKAVAEGLNDLLTANAENQQKKKNLERRRLRKYKEILKI